MTLNNIRPFTKPFMSVREVANLLDVEYKTIWRLVKFGSLPSSRIGNNLYRISLDDLEAFLEENRVKPQ